MSTKFPDWNGIEFRTYRAGDEQALVELYNRVFKAGRQVATWQWRYTSNVDGPPLISMAEYEGQIVAHFALIPRTIRSDGQKMVVFQGADAMVDDRFKHRQLMRGLIMHSAQLQTQVFGVRENIPSFIFGVLNFAHQKAGARYGSERDNFYLPIDDVIGFDPPLVAVRPAVEMRFEWASCRQGFREDDDELWTRTGSNIGWTTDRSIRYLTWRYASIPIVKYEMLRVYQASQLIGMLVVQDKWQDDSVSSEERLAIVDIIFPAANYEYLAPTLQLVAEEGNKRGRRAYLWSPSRHDMTRAISSAHWQPQDTGYKLMAFILLRERWTIEDLQRRVFHMIGDSEFGIDGSS